MAEVKYDGKDARDAKELGRNASAGGGGAAAPARVRATDAQKARRRREKSVELPVAEAVAGAGDDGEPQYITIKANDPNVEYRWAENAVAACYRWPGWHKTLALRSPEPTTLPPVPLDGHGFVSYLPGYAGRNGCHALVARVVSGVAAGDGARALAQAGTKVVAEVTFCPTEKASGCESTPVMCLAHCMSTAAWNRIHGIPCRPCRKHKVDQWWDYVHDEDIEDSAGGAAPGGAPNPVAPAASAQQQPQQLQQQQQEQQQQPLQPQQPLPLQQMQQQVGQQLQLQLLQSLPLLQQVQQLVGPQLQQQLLQPQPLQPQLLHPQQPQQQPLHPQQPQQQLLQPQHQHPFAAAPASSAGADLSAIYQLMKQQADVVSALQAEVIALRNVVSQQQLAPAPAPAPVSQTVHSDGPNYAANAGGAVQRPGLALPSPGGPASITTRPRYWIDPLSGMEVDTQTAKLSVSRDAAVVAVYNEWMRRKESKTIFEFLRAYVDHKEYVWRERPAVNGLPAVSVADQKKEWKDLIDQLQTLSKDGVDVTTSQMGLRILRKLTIIHRSDNPDIVAALSDSAMADPRELITFTRYLRGLPVSGAYRATAAVNANAPASRFGAPGGVPVVELQQQPQSTN